MEELTHREIRELLPWMANGTLEEPLAARLQRHLAGCAECRAELESERSLAAVVAEALAFELDMQQGLDRLERAIETESEPPRAGWQPTRRQLFAAVLAQGVILASLFGLLAWMLHPAPPAGAFRTLSSPAQTTSAHPTRLHVVVDPVTSTAELSRLLRASGCRIVGGPTPGGVWTVAVADGDAERALARLRRSPHVELAEPAVVSP